MNRISAETPRFYFGFIYGMIVLMETFFIYLVLIVIGLCMGSFAGASVWRLRAYQLKNDKAEGEKVNEKEYETLEKLSKSSMSKDYSRCLHCSYRLKWFDLVPLVSWLSLGGKCRKCHKPIGYMEPAIEICVAAFFALSYAFWPDSLSSMIGITSFIIWLVAGVGLAILFVYDIKWSLLPSQLSMGIALLGAINSLIVILQSDDKIAAIASVVAAVFILSGLYWVLNKLSKGKWVGFGDVELGLGLALLLADWKLAFIALFMANLVGCLIVLPPLIAGKLKRNSKVPFGPLLIVGFIFAKLAGFYLVSTYLYNLV